MDPCSSEAPASPRFSLLDSVGEVFAVNERERQRRLSVQRDKRAGERVHSNYLKTVLHPTELAQAKSVVNQYAKKNDKVGNSNRRFLRNNLARTLSPSAVRTRDPLRDREPNTMPQIIDLAVSPEVNSSLSRSQRNNSGSMSHNVNSAESSSFDFNSSRPSTQSSSRTSNNRGLDSSVVILSDDELDENCQIELAILRSLEDTSSDISSADISTNSTSDVVHIDRNSNAVVETTSITDRSASSLSDVPLFHICSVLNCETVFLTEAKLEEHRAALKHSPCNPCRLITDSKLPSEILAYACPKCGESFQVELKCTEHMCDKGHLSFLPAIPVSGYMCPDCLMMFGEKGSCHRHMTEQRHTSHSFPFSDDMSVSIESSPVPVSSGFAHDFYVQCISTEFSLSCIDCSTNVDCKAELTHRRNHPDHIVSASSNSTPLEVFMDYLSCLQCTNCGVLLPSSEVQLDDMHECIGNQMGIMEETRVKSFEEFVRLIGLKFILQFMGGFVTISSTFVANQSVACDVSTSEDPNSSSATSVSSSERGVKPHSYKQTLSITSPAKVNLPASQSGCQKRDIACLENKASTFATPPPRAIKRARVSRFRDATPPVGKHKLDNPQYNQRQPGIKRKVHDKNETSSLKEPSCPTSPRSCILSAMTDERQDEKRCSSATSISNTCTTATILPSSQSGSQKRDNDCSENKASNYTTTPPRALKRARVSRFRDATPPFAKRRQVHPHYNQRWRSPSVGFHNRARHADRYRQMRRPSRPPIQNISKIQPLMGPDFAVPTTSTFRPPQGVSQLPPLLGPESLCEPPSAERLSKMKLLIFLDLDNWPSFFKRLPRCLPDSTFVWAFWGGASQWREPLGFYSFTEQKRKGMFYLNEKSGTTKDAADFSLVLQIGMMNALLPKTVPFTILSGDRGFCQVEKEICASDRRLVLIDPHRSSKESPEMFYTLIISVFQD